LDDVIKALEEQLGDSRPEATLAAADELPHIAWQEHSEVYCETFVDSEAQQAKAYVSFKCMSKPSNTAAELSRQTAV
jgi:hypothetical protein